MPGTRHGNHAWNGKIPRHGFHAYKARHGIHAYYCPGTDISMSFLGSDTTIEVKRRATGFAQLYDRLNKRDMIVKADRQEPLVIVRLSLAAEIAKAGNEVA